MTIEDDPPVQDAPEPGGEAEADAPNERIIRRGERTGGSESPPDAAIPAPPVAAPRAMIPTRESRPPVEAALMRTIATAGVIGISVAIAAIMGSQHSKAWLIGLVTSVVSVVLAAVLWSSRRL
jgi:hypothetical protein